MKFKLLVTLLGAIALLLAADLIVALSRSGGAPTVPAVVLPSAQAQNIGSGTTTFVLDRSSYIITADTSGQHVYLWWFDRDPRKEQSSVTFIGQAQAR
ncbi:MAG: hypothetical protein Kow0059_04950 [Candidatus Sumerlaeia bacterium]